MTAAQPGGLTRRAVVKALALASLVPSFMAGAGTAAPAHAPQETTMHPSSPLSKTFLRQIARYNGFSLDDARLDLLLPALERGYAARERFRLLDLGETEPATVFRLPGGPA
jgi:hypothetical protein